MFNPIKYQCTKKNLVIFFLNIVCLSNTKMHLKIKIVLFENKSEIEY